MVEIIDIKAGSIANELNIAVGDKLLEIDGNKVNDYIDYQYSISADFFILTVEKSDGEIWDFEIEKGPNENLGIIVDGIIYDQLKNCQNNCLFCFVKQQPAGLRETLLLRDDDYRFSFLEGSFITLSNLNSEDYQRIINLKLSPLYISVHTTNPQLRVKMMKNPKTAEIMEQLKFLADNGISFHTQLVLCPGFNDGEELDRSINDLITFYPKILSIGVVPVGLTEYRDQLPVLRKFDYKRAKKTIEQIKDWQEKLRKEFGKNFLYVSDELYFLAGESIPNIEDYNYFPQIENGIGLTRLLWHEFSELEKPIQVEDIRVGIITGVLGDKALEPVVNELNNIQGLDIFTIPVENNFFGKSVTVTGLLTGQDIINGLKNQFGSETDYNSQIDYIFIPRIVLNKDNYFLDNLNIPDIEKKFPGMNLYFIENIEEMLEVLVNE